MFLRLCFAYSGESSNPPLYIGSDGCNEWRTQIHTGCPAQLCPFASTRSPLKNLSRTATLLHVGTAIRRRGVGEGRGERGIDGMHGGARLRSIDRAVTRWSNVTADQYRDASVRTGTAEVDCPALAVVKTFCCAWRFSRRTLDGARCAREKSITWYVTTALDATAQ